MKTAPKLNTSFFDISGGLAPNAPAYIERDADKTLLTAIKEGRFCAVFSPRQMGKTSLMQHAQHALTAQKIQSLSVSMAGSNDPDVDPEQLYLLFLRQLNTQGKLNLNINAWWESNTELPASTRLIHFWQTELLPAIPGQCLLFIDSLNANTQTEFVNGVLDAIEQVYADKTPKSVWKNFGIVILGQASPEDWGRGENDAPFADGSIIHLQEFSIAEAEQFRAGLPNADDETWATVFERVNYWTAGHPYLTQRIFIDIERMWDAHWDAERVDSVVDAIFFSYDFIADPNLQSVVDGIYNDTAQKSLLSLYKKIYRGKPIANSTDSTSKRHLTQIGLVKFDGNKATIRNNIYKNMFNQDWINAHTHLNWRLATVLTVIFGIVLSSIILVALFQSYEKRATQAEQLIGNIKQSNKPEVALSNLAALLDLPNYQNQVRTIFFDELSREDALALLAPANANAMRDDLIKLIRGVYDAPNLQNTETDDALLDAMRHALYALENDTAPGAIELDLEISQWLKGRKAYREDVEYQRAIDAYTIAINVNHRNPAIYFDRAMALVKLNRPLEALSDLRQVLALDNSWQTRIENSLQSDPLLYNTLWQVENNYTDLLALVPTPTTTPTPTLTPTETSTPTLTPTQTPIPPTATPSPTPTSTPTKTPTPRPTLAPTRILSTPTPSLSSAAFTLLSPNAQSDATSGTTEFNWIWNSSLPTGYGFEVRIWADGEPALGAHDSVLDNKNGQIVALGNNQYRLTTNIENARGIQNRTGEYRWTVVLVQIDPTYKDTGIQAPLGTLYFNSPTTGGGNSGGGVGIE